MNKGIASNSLASQQNENLSSKLEPSNLSKAYKVAQKGEQLQAVAMTGLVGQKGEKSKNATSNHNDNEEEK